MEHENHVPRHISSISMWCWYIKQNFYVYLWLSIVRTHVTYQPNADASCGICFIMSESFSTAQMGVKITCFIQFLKKNKPTMLNAVFFSPWERNMEFQFLLFYVFLCVLRFERIYFRCSREKFLTYSWLPLLLNCWMWKGSKLKKKRCANSNRRGALHEWCKNHKRAVWFLINETKKSYF